jgi:hypothetical protein
MGKREEFRIGERVEWDHLKIALRKRRGGKEQRRKGGEIGIKQFIYFFRIAFLCLKKNVKSRIGKPVGQNKAFINNKK